MGLFRKGRNGILVLTQLLSAAGMTALSRVRMSAITDSGTEIGSRAKLFREIIPQGGVGVEIGVYKGTLSKFIVRNNKPSRLYLVDPWWKYMPHWHWASGDTSAVRSLASILLVLEKEIGAGVVEPIIGGSLDALAKFEDGHLDWAYVDSTHAYEQTKLELALLKSKVSSTGIVAGDDWQADPEHRHHGVFRAVQEFLAAEPEYDLIFQENTQWALKRAS